MDLSGESHCKIEKVSWCPIERKQRGAWDCLRQRTQRNLISGQHAADGVGKVLCYLCQYLHSHLSTRSLEWLLWSHFHRRKYNNAASTHFIRVFLTKGKHKLVQGSKQPISNWVGCRPSTSFLTTFGCKVHYLGVAPLQGKSKPGWGDKDIILKSHLIHSTCSVVGFSLQLGRKSGSTRK